MNQLFPIIRRKRRPLLPVEMPRVEDGGSKMEDGKPDDAQLPPVEIKSQLTLAATKEIKHDAKTSITR